MTEKEYKEVCEIIESELRVIWLGNYNKKIIEVGGVLRIKNKIKELVME